MKREEIWLADFPRPDKRRPVVLVSRSDAYELRQQVTVAPVTTHLRAIPSHVTLGPEDGVDRDSAINCDGLTTVQKSALRTRLGTLTRAKADELDRALRFSLGLI